MVGQEAVKAVEAAVASPGPYPYTKASQVIKGARPLPGSSVPWSIPLIH